LIPKKSVFADITERNPKERGVMEVETMTLAQQALNLQKKTTGTFCYYYHLSCFFIIIYPSLVYYDLLEGLLSLLRDIGIAYLQLSKFNCRKSIQLFQSLPPRQYKTGFILSMIGKAYCEQSDYQQSIK
jgi:anaphase-promoting complex subunit 3